MGVVGALRLVERMLLATAALSFSAERAPVAIGITALLGIVAAARAAARAPLLARIRRRFLALTTEVLLGRRVLASAAERDETELVLFEALWSAEELAAERVPGLVADALAAALLCVLLASRLPGSLITMGFVVLLVAALTAEGARRVAGREAQRSWDAFLPLASSVEACIHGSVELVTNGRERAQRAVVDAQTDAWVRSAWRADWLAGLSGRVPLLVGLIGVVAAIGYAQTARGMTPEAALAEGLLVASFLPPFVGVLTSLAELSTATPRLAPLRELLAPEDDDAASAETPVPVPTSPVTLRWEDVDYAYPVGGGRGQRALSGASGEARPGRIVALAGPNGAGKSTLLRLLAGLDRPARGAIFVGDAALARIDQDAWRSEIAFMPQRPYLPSATTVRQAMSLLAPNATDGQMARALEDVGLWRRLRAEPHRAPLDVTVSALSAGERQRLALARILLKDASVVMLDEPDANLDRAGVELLGALLRELAKTKTVLIVAHDEELLGLADDVLRMKGSWMPSVEFGPLDASGSATA